MKETNLEKAIRLFNEMMEPERKIAFKALLKRALEKDDQI